MDYNNIREAANKAVIQLLEKANLKKGDIFLVGCSSSEVMGEHIGKASNVEVAEAIYEGIASVLKERGIYLAVQCCEHLNRAIILEKEALKPWDEVVNVVPKIGAGGAFAMTAYKRAGCPVAVECIKADAGMDIGDTIIGMHLRAVAVPVRIDIKKIGEANIVCARTRPKYIGGQRASYL